MVHSLISALDDQCRQYEENQQQLRALEEEQARAAHTHARVQQMLGEMLLESELDLFEHEQHLRECEQHLRELDRRRDELERDIAEAERARMQEETPDDFLDA
jgi:hypothetical protein